MKKTLFVFAGLLSILGVGWSQPCVIDTQYTAPGVYPSDTLPDYNVGFMSTTILHVVLPLDTNMFGLQVPYDSFKIAIPGLPPGLAWACAPPMDCRFITWPGTRTRACLQIGGVATQPTWTWPQYESYPLEITGFITFPFVGLMEVPLSRTIYVRCQNFIDGVEHGSGMGRMVLLPNPGATVTSVRFELETASEVGLQVMDRVGAVLFSVDLGALESGAQTVDVPSYMLPNGSYMVRLTMDGGSIVSVGKLTVLH